MAFRLLEMFKEILSGPKEELGKQKKCPSPFFEED
jgi:hypothetical protein